MVSYQRMEQLSIQKVRKMCVDYNLYTCGNCAEYDEMFAMCKQYKGDIDTLARIAENIVDHSDEEELSDYGYEKFEDQVGFVMGLLARECCWTSFRVKGVY